MHIITRGHFWSRDKDGGHAIHSAISENSMLHANLTPYDIKEAELLCVAREGQGDMPAKSRLIVF